MKIFSKTAAQERADQIKTFGKELAELEHERVLELTEEQQQAIAAHHRTLITAIQSKFDIDQTQQQEQLSRGMRIVSFLGALAFAASVFYLFRQFWGVFSTPVQVSILIIAPLISFIATAVLAIKESTGYFAKLMALVSFTCFVLNLVLIGEIFNIAPTDRALLIWAAFGFLLAYSFDIRLLLVAAILCLIAYLGARVGAYSGIYWLMTGLLPENYFLPAVVLIALPFVIKHTRYPNFVPTYHIFGLITLFVPMLVLANSGQLSRISADPDIIEGGYQVAGFILSAAAIWLGLKLMQKAIFNTAITFFVIFLYTKFFDWWWDSMPKYLFFLILALVAISCLLGMKRLRNATPILATPRESSE